MSKNQISEICKTLGLEIGEEFKIKGSEYIFHFVDNGLIAYKTDGSVLPHENCLSHFLCLVNGVEEIVKLPWKPKKGETCYTFELLGGKWIVNLLWWVGTPSGYALLDKGWVFRTQKEAEDALPKVASEMNVDYVIEWKSATSCKNNFL